MSLNRRSVLLSFVSLTGIFGAYMATNQRKKALHSPTYPVAPSDPGVSDSYFGVRVMDPYRPLEQLDSPKTLTWVEAENRLTHEYLSKVPGRSAIESYLEKIWNYPRTSLPKVESGRHFFTHNTGLEKQPRLYIADGYDLPWRLLLDPLTLDPNGTVSIHDFEPSPNGEYLAYALSDGGSDLLRWHIIKVDSGEKLEIIGFTKFTNISWASDSRGFYYSRHPAKPDGSVNEQAPVSVYFHRLRTTQDTDELVVALNHPTRNPFGTVSDDGRYLTISVFDGYEHNALYYVDLQNVDRQLVKLCDAWDARYYFVGNVGGTFFVHTTLNAPHGRIMAIDLASPQQSSWRTHVAETKHAIETALHVGEEIITVRLVDASSQVDICDAVTGAHKRLLKLPSVGSVAGFHGRAGNPKTFFSFASFNEPPRLYRYDMHTDELNLWQSSALSGLPACTVDRIETTSADGTPVRAFVLAPPNARRDGATPVLLYGYGGFGVSITPSFSTRFQTWIAMGGIVVIANLRGGGENGEAWHLGGTRFNKQHGFDDFIAVAEYLIAENYTSPAHLAILGGSNGGLLVGAVANQHPELFAAVVAQVGLLDMLRYQLACENAEQWGTEYGISTASEAEFKNLLAFSPYHNISPDKAYPSILAITGDHDNRVEPWHTYKWVAQLQAVVGNKPEAQPILLRVETRAGHGAGKSLTQAIAETADVLLFLKEVIPGLRLPV